MVSTVTVIMACYNGEKWLPEQLASLAAQTGVDFTVLMQDDGSTDGTPALLQNICKADSRFRLAAENGQHFGAIGNFWSLLRQCGSDYIALCDQDDKWHPDHLAALVGATQKAEARLGSGVPVLAHSDCRVTVEDGSPLHDSFFAHQGWDPGATTLNRLLVQNNVTGCCCMINAALRDLAIAIGDPARMRMHDWFLALTAAAFGEVVFVPKALTDYRQHGTNVMGASRRSLPKRGLAALGKYQQGKARIELTYTHTEAFRDACGSRLTGSALTAVDRYLSTRNMSKLRRVTAVRRMGCTMQSRITRLGQLIFG